MAPGVQNLTSNLHKSDPEHAKSDPDQEKSDPGQGKSDLRENQTRERVAECERKESVGLDPRSQFDLCNSLDWSNQCNQCSWRNQCNQPNQCSQLNILEF